MRRFTALLLFVLGYSVMAALDPAVAAVPCVLAFTAGAYALVPESFEADLERAGS